MAILCIGRYRRQFFDLLRSNGGALIAINASNELINLGGGLANRFALIFAPLAVVQTIGSTTTLFVFLIGVLLSLVAPSISRENLSAREFAQKGIAAVLVAIGVALISRLSGSRSDCRQTPPSPPGLDPGVRDAGQRANISRLECATISSWIAGSSPAMTTVDFSAS